MTTPSCDNADLTWLQNENLVLQDTLDVLQEDHDQLMSEFHFASVDASVTLMKYQTLRKDFTEKLQKSNGEITNKAVALSNLADEYQKVLDEYVCRSSTAFITQDLQRLRVASGYLKLEGVD